MTDNKLFLNSLKCKKKKNVLKKLPYHQYTICCFLKFFITIYNFKKL